MIILTRLNGHEFALNCDLIERADETPDTVITLVDGTKYVVIEPVATVIELIRHYRSSVIASADDLATSVAATRRPHLQVVSPAEER